MNNHYDEFLRIAKILNDNFEVTPLLYGSLGLQQLIDTNLEVDDIDILVPDIYINEKWNSLKKIIEKLGYEMVDLHEHEFENKNFKIAFSDIESLKGFANIDIKDIKNIEVHNINYKLLNLKQYLNVYSKSMLDGYRQSKKEDRDLAKIKIIKSFMEV